jgi:hypothetical protein
MGLKDESYKVLREDLLKVRPDLSNREVLLCPLCLCEIPEADIMASGIEHIIPQVVVRNDPDAYRTLANKNQRCGITVLCRQSRILKSNGDTLRNGCNGYKGQTYDWVTRNILDDQPRTIEDLQFRHGVALLTMGYLGAFQIFGYSYILRPELDEVREQFDFPNERRTNWLLNVHYSMQPGLTEIVATSTGQPFVVGGVMNGTAPLEVYFRRTAIELPSGWTFQNRVRTLESLLPINEE